MTVWFGTSDTPLPLGDPGEAGFVHLGWMNDDLVPLRDVVLPDRWFAGVEPVPSVVELPPIRFERLWVDREVVAVAFAPVKGRGLTGKRYRQARRRWRRQMRAWRLAAKRARGMVPTGE